MVHGFISSWRRVLSETKYSLLRWQLGRRHRFSLVAHKAELDKNNVDSVPKLPPFDYSPPPYTGPSAVDILSKRKEYLSPSMFYFYQKPVSFILTRHPSSLISDSKETQFILF